MNTFRKLKFAPILSLALLAACGTPRSHGLDVVNRASTSLGYRDISRLPVETPMNAYLTGYSYWDNTPRGSAQIARPVIHRSAGGAGTYSDPVTLAVGHVKKGGRSIMDYPAGTRFYIKRLRKYAIVEDLCGDGHRPQDGPCHSGHQGHDWIDIYVGGRRMAEASVDACMRHITGIQPVILNPQPGHPVEPGEIASSGCRKF
ncbi:hypothetical protein R1T40_03435 [Tritonibacter scottomollicae]|uniref:Lipoprotein n=1 Tax=Tritonibacter scottomollicae TaxID=483013 RepID=A0ABZ0HI53_TRISK|nr:hypothetical protein [Tritonibacter scottomollicae]WOI33814.1 hypothetical protein R1T40_03435 [Tritonibacter scottomollicae]